MYKKRLVTTIVSIFALGVIFGIFAEEFGTFSLRAVFVATFALSALFVLYAKFFGKEFNKKILAVALAVAAFSFGGLRVSISANNGLQMAQFDNVYDTAKFEITEINSGYINAKVVSSENKIPKNTKVRLYLDSVDGFVKGDRFVSDVKYNYKNTASYKASGIYLTASAKIESFEKGQGLLYKIRESVYNTTDELYSGFDFAPGIAKAITVGDKGSMDSYVYSLFKASGMSHVLAISGLHVTLFAFGIYSLLSTFMYNRKVKALIALGVAVMYGALVGFSPSVLRAVVMFCIIMLLELFLRRADTITSLFMSLLLLLLINPYSICSTGMHLSYLCSLGIILVQHIIFEIQLYCELKTEEINTLSAKLIRMIPAVLTPLLISFSSSVFSFPVLCANFDTVCIVSPITNILLVPMFSYAIGFSVIGYVIAPICMPLARLVAYPAGFVFDLTAKISRYIYDSDIGSISTHTFWIIVPFAFSLLMIYSLVVLDRYKIHTFVCSSVMFIISLYVCSLVHDSLRNDVSFAEYKSTDSYEYIYYQSPQTNIYIDAGGYYISTEPIYDNGFTALDSYYVAEYDRFSLSRFEKMSGSVKIKSVYLSAPQNNAENEIYLQIKELANKRNCDIIEYDYNKSVKLDNKTTFDIYCEPGNTRSTLIGFNYGDVELKFVKGNYTHPVYGDTVVFMEDFTGDVLDVFADVIYATNEYVQSNKSNNCYLTSFEEKLTVRIEDNS